MALKRFNKIFEIQDSLEKEQKRFVQRINQTIFNDIEKNYHYGDIFRKVCFYLGENPDDIIEDSGQESWEGGLIPPNLREVANNDFTETIKIVCLVYQYFNKQKEEQNKIDGYIREIFSQATIDLGIKWKNGMFYPAGAKLLDEKLIEDPLSWLEIYPDEKKDFLNAFIGYSTNKLDEVVINCYLAIEGLVRKILNNTQTLDNNREKLLKKIGLSQEWKSFLSNYIKYANEFKRHASEKRHSINPLEAEAFFYFTGLIVRLLIESNK